MKKNFIFTLSLFISTYFPVYAQEPIVKWGEPITNSKNPETKIQKLFTTSETGFYAYRKSIRSMGTVERYWLEKYNDSYNLVYSKEIPNAEGMMGDALLFEEILPVKDKIAVFYRGFKKAAKESFLIVRNVSSNGTVEKNDIKLESIPAEKGVNSGGFNIVTSPDQSKMLTVATYPFDKNLNAKIRVKVFDTNGMKELWSKEVELNYNSRKGSIIDLLLDNNGNAYITGRHSAENKKYKYTLYTYNAALSEWKENAIEIKNNKTISDDNHKLLFDAKGDVVFTGFLYSNTPTSFDELFYVRVNGKTQAVEAITQMGYGNAEKGEKEYISFTRWGLKDVVSLSNGNVLIIGENDFGSEQTANPQGGPFSYIYEYRTKEIRIASIQPDGSKAWIRSVDKEQVYTTDTPYNLWGSFVYTLINDRLYIVYNNWGVFRHSPTGSWTETDGTNTKMSYKMFAENTAIPVFMYIVEPNGSLTYGNKKYGLPLLKFQEGIYYPMYLNASAFYPLNNGIIMMDEMKNNERYQFGKIIF